MVLPGRLGGRVGRRRILLYKSPIPQGVGGFFYPASLLDNHVIFSSFRCRHMRHDADDQHMNIADD